jgi:hypothetical protein
MNVLYYSARCEHCKRLFAEFQLQPNTNNTGLSLVDVDNSQEALPPYLRVVPTLVLGGTNEKYEGKDVFSALRARLVQQQQSKTPVVEPYAFSCSNVTNKGFSFINTDHPVYSEQANYAFFT